MQKLVVELAEKYEEDAVYAVLKRVFDEHFIIEDAALRPKKGDELSANSLQSPDDLEATFRKKRGEQHIGYVSNVTETADPDNPFQLILKVQTESNTTDDAEMLADALPELVERTDLERMHSDGGYNSAEVDTVCQDEGVELVQTAIRGGQPSSEQVNLADFTFELDEEGNPVGITCPERKEGVIDAARNEGRYTATFEQSDCAGCPLLARCQMRVLKKTADRRLYFSIEDTRLARRRQRMAAERKSGRNLRSAVEATVREISCRLEHGRLRVRGKFRVSMTMMASAVMANARRIWRYQVAKKTAAQGGLETQNGQFTQLFGNIGSLFRLNGRISARASCFSVSAIFFARLQKLTVVF